MIITCPSCATRYRVPDAAFSSDSGRRVRCQSCSFQWFAVPEEEPAPQHDDANAPEGLVDDVAGPDQAEPVAGAAELDLDQATEDFTTHLAEAARLERNLAAMGGRRRGANIEAAARRNHRSTGPDKRFNVQGWGTLAATLALCLLGGFEYRETIVRAVPRASHVYEAAGLTVNVIGVDFLNVRVAREFENGLPVLAVEGEVVNVSEGVIDVPRVRLGLRDADAQEIYHWTVPVASGPLLPSNRVRFATKLASPPSNAKDVMIRFSDANMRLGSL